MNVLPRSLACVLPLVIVGCADPIVGDWTLERYWVDGVAVDLDTWQMGPYEYEGSRTEIDLTIEDDLRGELYVDVCYSDICEDYTMDVTGRRATLAGQTRYELDATTTEDGVEDLAVACVVDEERLTCDGDWGDRAVTMEFGAQ